MRSAKAVARDEGVSGTTIWRRLKAGWLVQVNIAGKPYITLDSLDDFYRRARNGEFAQDPHGACKKKAPVENNPLTTAKV